TLLRRSLLKEPLLSAGTGSGIPPDQERSTDAHSRQVRKRVKPEIGIRAMYTKQVACDVLARRHPRGGRCRSLSRCCRGERGSWLGLLFCLVRSGGGGRADAFQFAQQFGL